jgi:hypothetical protein
MKLNINDTITWSSAAGKLTGKIINIVLAENAAEKTVPWIDVIYGENNCNGVRICATHSNLKMMKVAKTVDPK